MWFPAGGYRIRRPHITSPFASEDKRLPAAKPDCFFMPVPNIGVEAFHIGLESFPGFRTFAAQTKKNGFPTMSVRPCEILNCGDVYLFPETNSRCQGRSSLWSVIVSRKRNVVLESDTGDYRHFAMWRPLAVGCRYCRLAKRSEFRDYRVNLTYAEMRKIG